MCEHTIAAPMSGAHREFIEIYVQGGLRDVQNVQIRCLQKIHTYLSILYFIYYGRFYLCTKNNLVLFIHSSQLRIIFNCCPFRPIHSHAFFLVCTPLLFPFSFFFSTVARRSSSRSFSIPLHTFFFRFLVLSHAVPFVA